MLYQTELKIEAFYVPTGEWHTFRTKHGVRAVSARHATDKALRYACSLPFWTDREDSPDWTGLEARSVYAEGHPPWFVETARTFDGKALR